MLTRPTIVYRDIGISGLQQYVRCRSHTGANLVVLGHQRVSIRFSETQVAANIINVVIIS